MNRNPVSYLNVSRTQISGLLLANFSLGLGNMKDERNPGSSRYDFLIPDFVFPGCSFVQDWPPSTDFKSAFPELFEDFSCAVPVPNYVRRDGTLNVASHFPVGTISPDLGRSVCLQ